MKKVSRPNVILKHLPLRAVSKKLIRKKALIIIEIDLRSKT